MGAERGATVEGTGRPEAPAVRPLDREELPAAAGVAARALQDDPTNVASYGDDALARLVQVYRLFTDVFAQSPGTPYGAVAGGCVVAVAGVMEPGRCIGDMMGAMAADVLSGPVPPLGDPWRAAVFWATWAMHDLPVAHCHIGPVGVEPGFQGLGIGRSVMAALCADLDARGRVGWLETNKERNLRFYGALGFEVVERVDALGVPNWFMRRDPVDQRRAGQSDSRGRTSRT